MNLLRVALAAAVMALSGVPAQTQPGETPNVVLIMTDDMGYADLGSYGATDIRTPNIDSLGRDGVKLTDFYANGMSCSPTRAGLISGRYQQRYGINFALPPHGLAGTAGLPALSHSLPLLLKKNGYATALVGKWHLGYAPSQSPAAHGFDSFFGHKSPAIDYYSHLDPQGAPDLWENDTPIQQDGYMTDLITQRAIAFLERAGKGPFFLDVAYNAPHGPFQTPDHRPTPGAEPRPPTRAEYASMIERVDRGVGEILQALQRIGAAGNTIVIFTNDNGGVGISSNAPLFHRKFSAWEGGIRVPALVRWPGRIPAGSVSSQVGITMDLTASILAATRSTVPADARFDGIDLMPILRGQQPAVERTLFWRTGGNAQQANMNQRAVRSGDWKLLVDGHESRVFLFNVRADAAERDDWYARRRDIADPLRRQLTEWENDVDAEARQRATPR